MLGFESGDVIDLVFNLDINDYKNVQSEQIIIRDARLSHTYTDKLENDKQRYLEIKKGAKYSVAEGIVPDREDCSRVYTFLRREYRNGNSLTDTKSVLRALNVEGEKGISYTKLKYIFDIFNELQICDIEELDTDIYRFEVIFRAAKTSIDKSAILKKLRSQCIDRIAQ